MPGCREGPGQGACVGDPFWGRSRWWQGASPTERRRAALAPDGPAWKGSPRGPGMCRRPLLGSIEVVGEGPAPRRGVVPRRHRTVEPGKALLQGACWGWVRWCKRQVWWGSGRVVGSASLHPPCQPGGGLGPVHQPARSAAAILILCGAGGPAR